MIQDSRKTIKEFTDLKAWQESHQLVIMIYKVTKNFPKEELFALSNQLKRAGISITSNIAEGFGRHSYKEKVQFYYQAQGSLVEAKNQLILAKDVNFINQVEYELLLNQANIAHQLLQGLLSKTKSFANHKS